MSKIKALRKHMKQRRISKLDISVGSFIYIDKTIIIFDNEYDTDDRIREGTICLIKEISRKRFHRNSFMITLSVAETTYTIPWRRLRDNIITKDRQ